MAVINGFLAKSVIGGIDNPYIADDVYGFSLPVWPPHDSAISNNIVSTLITSWPVEANPNSIQGFIANSYSNDFYYRIHLTPSRIDLGNISSLRVVNIELWNAFFTQKLLQQISSVDAEGITLSGGPTVPHMINPLQTIPYVLTITPDGPAVINAQFNWLIDGVSYSVIISGRRSVVFPFPPQYKNTGPVESFEFLTLVNRKETGSEQRRSLRIQPRRVLSFNVELLKSKYSQIFKNLMWGWQNRAYSVPVWTDISYTTTANAIGSKVINLATSNKSFRVGDSAILYSDPLVYEVFEIESMTATTLVSKTELVRAWPAVTQVLPIIIGHLREQQPVVRPIGDYLTANLRFVTSADNTWSYLPDTAANVVYDGLEVITDQPNWVRGLDEVYNYQFDTLDNQTGPIQWIAKELYSGNNRNYSWLLRDKIQIVAMRSFLRRTMGRFKTFWVPSWSHDFDLLTPIGSTSKIIRVAENGFRLLVGVDPAHDRLVVMLKNGNWYYRKIVAVGVVVDGVSIDIELDSTFGLTINPDDIDYISFLDRCRMSSDIQIFTWQTPTVVVYETNFTSVIK